MKTVSILKTLVMVSVASATMLLTSCGGEKEAQTMEDNSGFKAVEIPCGKEGRSDKDFFRADASAVSQNMQASREKALMNAKQRLASNINPIFKAATDEYVNETTVGDASNYEDKFETMAREVVNQKLTDVAVVCEKTGQDKNGKWQTFIAIEVNKETLLNGLNEGITKDQKLRVDYDKMKYEKIFNEEMEKLEKESGY